MKADDNRNIALPILILCSTFLITSIVNAEQKGPMTQEEYRQRLRSQTKYHQLLNAGDRAKKGGDNQLAAQYYEQALDVAKGSSLEGVTRGELSRLYERMGLYEKALENVQWILEKADKSSPLLSKYLETKKRLLGNLQKKKNWESKQNPIVPKAQAAFDKADYEEQKQFLESLGGEGVWDIFKDAMVAEHGGDFGKAREIYESLLPRKEEIDTQMGTGGWAMLYPAIQRTSELLGDDVREKEALIWIKDNLLNGEGQHHGSLKKLRPEVVLHIQKRIEKFQL